MVFAAIFYKSGKNAAPRPEFGNRIQATPTIVAQGSSVPVAPTTETVAPATVSPATTAPSGTASAPVTPTEAATAEENEALVPDFSLNTLEGGTASLSDFRGKVVVLNFWTSWCPPCKAEMPEFETLNQEFEDAGDVVLVTINLTDGQRETKEKAAEYIKDGGYTFRVLLDEKGEVGGMFGIEYIPTTAVIDAKGRLVTGVQGGTTATAVREMVDEARDSQ